MLPKIEEIKTRRKALKLTQSQLAKKASISHSLLVKIERGTVKPSYDKAERIFASLESEEAVDQRKAEGIMTKHVITARESQKLSEVVKIMKAEGLSQIPALDRAGRVVGSVTEQGIVERIGFDGIDLSKAKVHEVMKGSLPTVTGEMPLDSVVDLLRDNQAVLVMEKGKIAGIITKSDII
jgi:predicted transcriptional regulator